MRANRGDDLASSVAVLSATRLTDLCIDELQSLIVVLSPAVSRLAGLQAAVLGELAGRGGGAVSSPPGRC